MCAAGDIPILVVCRSSAEGLIAAQRLAAGELSGSPTWRCLGLVVVANGPGPLARPLARPLAELAALVGGGYPAQWPIPWMESWRVRPSMASTRKSGPGRPPGFLTSCRPTLHRTQENR